MGVSNIYHLVPVQWLFLNSRRIVEVIVESQAIRRSFMLHFFWSFLISGQEAKVFAIHFV